MRVIAQIVYFFDTNEIKDKKFLRIVDKETEKSYLIYYTGESFNKSKENKPIINMSYGTITMWKSRYISKEYLQKIYDKIRVEMVKELKKDLKEYLIYSANNINGMDTFLNETHKVNL